MRCLKHTTTMNSVSNTTWCNYLRTIHEDVHRIEDKIDVMAKTYLGVVSAQATATSSTWDSVADNIFDSFHRIQNKIDVITSSFDADKMPLIVFTYNCRSNENYVRENKSISNYLSRLFADCEISISISKNYDEDIWIIDGCIRNIPILLVGKFVQTLRASDVNAKTAFYDDFKIVESLWYEQLIYASGGQPDDIEIDSTINVWSSINGAIKKYEIKQFFPSHHVDCGDVYAEKY